MSSPPVTSVSIQEWEDASGSLIAAFNKYIDLSLSLGTNALKSGIIHNDLSTKVPAALHTLKATLNQQLDQTCSTLARARNQIRCSTNCLPDEILASIFALVIFPQDPSETPPMRQHLASVYCSLYDLLGVCSAWRDILMAHGAFWSIIPVTESTIFKSIDTQNPNPTIRSIARSQGMDLYLAGISRDYSEDMGDLAYLAEHASRVRTVNIMSDQHRTIKSIMDNFEFLNSSWRLSEISLNLLYNPAHSDSPLSEHFFPSITDQNILTRALPRLSVLKLWGGSIDWSGAGFSDRLVELELRNIRMSHGTELPDFLATLPSATQLQHLRIIEVQTWQESSTTNIPKISLPRLKTLLLKRLYFNTLRDLISSLTSRSHHLTLHIANQTFCVMLNESTSAQVEFDQPVLDVFRGITCSVLYLDNYWPEPTIIRRVMRSLPDIHTLVIDNITLLEEHCNMLERSPDEDGFPFPRFKTMQFSRMIIENEDAFQRMVQSYLGSLQLLELGGWVSEVDTPSHCLPLQDRPDYTIWFQENIPEFKLIDKNRALPGFDSPWQL
ncbi:hypothetical protein RSOLAG1IB_09729 [Rhizoctonia solani AG-1 IB]|uniref:F-box domain-containing protein n=1 Tax=Thanatephorus cucumeris (strain AG1-IB / isolate 7/3/14) TaxID=1108050 RepID=A0A0B7FWI1_THACB|nr:hypothetical protein RSOLAG1IB_09729 [Rhizoctonia solani AG-1 IB]